MASKTIEIVKANIVPQIEKMGYEVIEIDFSKRVDGMNLEITIDCDAGVNIDDCEKVHRAIDEPLDTLDPTNGSPYILSVSSPGIDRPIKTQRDAGRNMDKPVLVRLYQKVDGKKEFEGLLKDFDEKSVTIEIDGTTKKFELSLVGSIAPIIKF